MIIHNLTAKMSDWCYSSLINIPAPMPREPTTTPREHRIVAELRDHNAAPFSATLQLLGRGCKRHRARPGA